LLKNNPRETVGESLLQDPEVNADVDEIAVKRHLDLSLAT